MSVNHRRNHILSLHKGNPNRDCTLCTQERAAAALKDSHAAGLHVKVPRQTCPECRAVRAAQWQQPKAGVS